MWKYPKRINVCTGSLEISVNLPQPYCLPFNGTILGLFPILKGQDWLRSLNKGTLFHFQSTNAIKKKITSDLFFFMTSKERQFPLGLSKNESERDSWLEWFPQFHSSISNQNQSLLRGFTLTVKVLKFSLLEQKGTYTWYFHCSFMVLGDLGTD